MGVVIVIHVLVCFLLGLIILMQSGRGGGLTEQFAAAESMFGAKTNVVLVKATTVLASIFVVTSLSLAFLSSQSGKSLINEKAIEEAAEKMVGAAKDVDETQAGSVPADNQIPVPAQPEGANPKENVTPQAPETQTTPNAAEPQTSQ